MKNLIFPFALLASVSSYNLCQASPAPATPPPSAASALSSTITIAVEGQNQQSITHWGFATRNRADWGPSYSIVNYPNSMAALYGDMGANIVRLFIPHDINERPKVRQAFKDGVLAATSRGMQWYGVPWSPPLSMKTINGPNGKINGQLNRLKPNYEDDVAVWLTGIVTSLTAEGVPAPVALGPQNEPDFGPSGYPGCVYTSIQMKRAVIELRSKLNAAGLSGVAVTGNDGATPDSNSTDTGSINMLGLVYPGGFYYNDSNYRNALGIVSTHTYDLHNGLYTSKPGYMANWYDLAGRTNKPLWMTEWETRHEHTKSNWEVISETVAHFNRDVSSMKFNGWFSWQVWDSGLFNASEPFVEGNKHHMWVQDNGTTLQKRPLFYVFRRIWKNAPAGGTFVRRVTSSDPSIQDESRAADPKSYRQDLAAFRSGAKTTVVLLNRNTSTKTVEVTGLLGSSARIYRYQKSDATTTNRDLTLVRSVTVAGGKTQTFTLLPETLNILITD